MTLFEYLKKNKITRKEFAEALGYSDSSMDQYFRHIHPVSKKFATVVEMYTKGEVKAEALMKRSRQGMKRRKELLGSSREGDAETMTSCYGVCKACNKKLNEIGL